MTSSNTPTTTNISFDDGYCYIESVKTKSRESKIILNKMKVDFPENAITAILGPSGSGKTTLMSVITDSISMNIKANALLYLPGGTTFIPQFDQMYGFFTCQSYMEHYARLSGISSNQPDIKERISKLLKQLGLQEQTNTMVGDMFIQGLSGGQKRRLSVALEALTQPMNLILDEPTSGLDAESAYQVMEFLKSYVREIPGRRVILTIHQPSAFLWKLIDHTILLSKGKLMYNGPRCEMEDFFETAGYPTPQYWNPADHYVTVVNDEFRNHTLSVKGWAHSFQHYKLSHGGDQFGLLQRTDSMLNIKLQNNKVGQQTQTEQKTIQRTGAIQVTKELTYRYFVNMMYNPGILGTRIAMYAMLAGMCGALFWNLGDKYDYASIQSRIALSFYNVSFFIFMSVAVLPFSVMERDIIDKEVLNRYYHPSSYQLSLAISSIPGAAILAFIVTLLIITMTGMRSPLQYFITMFFSLVVAEAMAILISHVVPHFVIGMAMLAGMYGFFMLFQGFMITPSNFPDWLGWVYNVAFHSYSWRTFMMIEFGPDDNGNQITFDGLFNIFQTGQDVLLFYEIDDVDITHDMIVLFVYALIIHMTAIIVLYLRYNVFAGKIMKPIKPMKQQLQQVQQNTTTATTTTTLMNYNNNNKTTMSNHGGIEMEYKQQQEQKTTTSKPYQFVPNKDDEDPTPTDNSHLEDLEESVYI